MTLSPVEHLVKEREWLKKMNNPAWQINQLNNAVRQGDKHKLDRNIDLLAYCLMPNHFHLVIYQEFEKGIEILTRRIISGYTGHFNKKYKRRGPLFENRYKANHFCYDPKLQVLFTARYVERNSKGYEYPYSSLHYFKRRGNLKEQKPIWLNTQKLKRMFQEIKSNPNGVIEEEVARFNNYYNFVVSDLNFDLEDVRLSSI
ncbi:MAG: transposase [Nanoarchaeota archaeon]|nr:transposase [Nanoarchaeota archaeon]